MCDHNQYIYTGNLRFESSQHYYLGQLDDTAANGFKFKCVGLDANHENDSDELSAGDGHWGTWRGWSDSYDMYLVCGV